MILSPERDAVIFDAVKNAVGQAHTHGAEANKLPRRNMLYAIGVILALALLIFAGILATPHFPALYLPADKPMFADGAPSWELTIIGETPTEAQGDPIIIDAKVKMGSEWGYGGSVQYKDYLYLRTVNYADPSQIRVLVYHWTVIGGWQYFDDQDI